MPNPVIEHIYRAGTTYDVKDVNAERSANKTSTFQTNPDNTRFPTEKLVKDNLDLKENKANRVSAFQNVPDNAHYPSEKLVKDSLDALREEFTGESGEHSLSQYEEKANRKTTWGASPSDEKYPSEKLVKESLDGISTVVVNSLPAIADALETVNYILKSGDGGLLYKKINNAWVLVGGSKIKVLASLPASGDSFTDFYVPNGNTGRYTHYRWMDAYEESGETVAAHFYAIGVDAYSKTEADTLLDEKEAAVNKVTSWSAEPNDTRYPSEKLVKDALDEIAEDVDNIDVVTTIVVNALPALSEANPDFDYILKKGNGALLYKKIDGAWKMVGGAMVSVVTALPLTGDSNTDYYVGDGTGVYLHYRWMDAYEKNGETVAAHFYAVGSDAYSKSEVDTLLGDLEHTHTTDIGTLNDSILGLGRAIDTNAQKITELEGDQKTYRMNLTHEDQNYIVQMTENEEVVSQFILPATGGGSSGGQTTSTMTVTRITASPVIATPTDRVQLVVDFSSVDGDNETVDGAYVLKLGNTVIMSGSMLQGRNTFDVTEFCSVGSQKFTLNITDDGGSADMKTWTVQVVDVRIESAFSDRYTNSVGRAVNFTYTPYGSVSKVVHFRLDGVDLPSVTTSASGILQSYSISAQSHGAHLLECWITATINGTNIETDHIFRDIIWFDPSLDAPVIGCIYRYDHYGVLEAKQYNNTPIPYVVYDPRTENPTVELSVDGSVINTLHLTSAHNTWSYKSDVISMHILTITCRTTTVTLRVEVTELGYTITPITANLAFDFNPSGMSNSSTNRMWVDPEDPNVRLTVSSNFDWENGGYQTDESGNQYFCVKSGTRAYISHNLFGINPKQDGAEFKIVFKTTNVRDKDATFLTCLASDPLDKAGLRMNTHEAYVYTSSDSLMTPYSEEDVIEFEYNINPIDTNDLNATSFIMSYEDGVAARPIIYQNDSSYLLHQLTPVPITIGSDDCDVHIYRMKAYTSALSDTDILANFIADARDSDTMIARYERNQIYDENQNLTPESVAAACPDLKVIKIEAPHFTNNKSDYVRSTNVQCIHRNGDPVLDNWTFRNMYHAGQGTTSNAYGLAGRNIDIIGGFDGVNQVVSKISAADSLGYVTEVTLGDGTRYTGADAKIALTRTSVPNTWFNIKVNIASSENANNALLQKRYNDYIPYKTPGQRRDPRAKNSMEFVNCVVFIKESDPDLSTHREFADTNWHFYAIGNIGDSKKTDNTRVNDPEDLDEFVVEISDNTLPNSTFDTGVYYDEHGGITYDPAEAALNTSLSIPSKSVYPITRAQFTTIDGYVAVSDEDLLVKKNLPIFYEMNGSSYVKTADTDIVPGKTYYMVNYRNKKYESLYVDIFKYNRDTGKTDQISGWDSSFEFRYDATGTKDGESMSGSEIEELQTRLKQVFRDMYEFVITSRDDDFVSHFGDWFITESFLYWYLFTERYTMIDNRSKNSFWHWGKTYISEEEAAEMGDDAANYTINNAAAAINNGYRFDLWDYDNDTALGIDNNGELNMTYGHEDTDYKTDGDPSSGYIFNAADSVIWRRIRQLMGTQLRAMYQSRESLNCWKASSLIAEFDTWQEQFPEELWRLDIERKYLRSYYTGNPVSNTPPTKDFLQNMMNGRKRYQRRQFERNQEVYIGTKYFGSNQCNDSQAIRFRCNTPQSAIVRPNYTLRITPYSDMYLSVAYGNASPQSVRAKAGVEYIFTTSLTTMDDTQILIYCAENIQALNDLSACYIRANNFAYATRLKTLVIGSDVAGYSNPFITELSIGNNKLLETLDIRNCPNLTGTLNLSSCVNLEELLAEGTSITSVSFAANGKIETAHLPATINGLTLRYLNRLTDLSLAGYDNLISLTSEYCGFDPYTLISRAINTLQILRVLGIEWSFSDTAFLNRIYAMSESTLAGEATITGSIRMSEIEKFGAKWKDLTLNYNPSNLVPQYVVTYKNYDGTNLYYASVDSGSLPIEPVSAGLIPAPTRAPDDQNTYTFSGWTDMDVPVTDNKVVTAQFTTSLKTYTVRWFAHEGDMTPLHEEQVMYGSEAFYNPATLPTDNSGGSSSYHIFTGWDKSTGRITGDTNVYATWQTGVYPAEGKELKDMTPVEMYAVSARGEGSGRYKIKDYFELPLGWDFNFANVRSTTILQNRYFTGETGSFFDTEIELFDSDSPSFTLAVDYEFLITCRNRGTLVSCVDQNSDEGFRLEFIANSTNRGQSYSAVEWTNSDLRRIGRASQRNIIVIRHRQGDSNLNVYSFNGSQLALNSSNYNQYEDSLGIYTLIGSKNPDVSAKLTFGAVREDSEMGTQHGRYAAGWVYWAKIWYDDLGNDVCKKLASWPHETIRMEYAGGDRQLLSTSNNLYADSSFYANQLLSLRLNYSSANYSTQTWDGSSMQNFFRNRLLPGIEYKWQSIIKPVKVNTCERYNSSRQAVAIEKLYPPAYVETTSGATGQYAFEADGGYIDGLFGTTAARNRWPGIVVEDRDPYNQTPGRRILTNGNDPTSLYSNVTDGDIWYRNNQGPYYWIYVSEDTYNKHSMFGSLGTWEASNVYGALDGGYWIRNESWWTRSPYASGAGSFMYWYHYYTYFTNGSYSNYYGVLFGLSI